MTNINDLIRSGFNRRQVGALSALGGDPFAEVPVSNWFPYVYPSVTGNLEVVAPQEVTPDPVLLQDFSDWIDGPDIALEAGTNRLQITNAGLYLVQLAAETVEYVKGNSGDVVDLMTAEDLTGFTLGLLAINSPTGWGTALQSGHHVLVDQGTVRLDQTLYLPAGTTLGVTLGCHAQFRDHNPDGSLASELSSLVWRAGRVTVQLTRFAPGAGA